jgi:hypothetical protein
LSDRECRGDRRLRGYTGKGEGGATSTGGLKDPSEGAKETPGFAVGTRLHMTRIKEATAD